jgi:subtilase family serine protease
MTRFTTLCFVGASLALAACADSSKLTAPSSAKPSTGAPEFNNGNGVNGQAIANAARVCPGAVMGTARCHAWVVTDASGKPFRTTGPSGYAPADLQAAYALASASANSGAGATVAIVDAYDDPKAESDLGVYRSQFHLPACTTANGCFKKVNQNGIQGSYPAGNASWSQEISLDLDMVSAICPNCHILLVEANSANFSDLSTAVDAAANTAGVVAISNSYGGSEYAGETADQSHYNHPNVAVTVSSGDYGYGVQFPAASQYVIAVGGTHLARASNARGFTETVWSGAGSGCSAYITKPSWQTDPSCARRTVADVSADADPNTGVSVYDTYSYRGASGWLVFGGTSVASPIIASVYALGGNGSGQFSASYLYSNTPSLFDVTSGSNGSCGGSYLCTGAVGYDGPTGLGTPNGVSSF